MTRSVSVRRGAAALATALVVAATTLIAGSPAVAGEDDLPPAVGASYLGPLHIEPSSGSLDPASQTYFSRVWTEQACPSGTLYPWIRAVQDKAGTYYMIGALNNAVLGYAGPLAGPYDLDAAFLQKTTPLSTYKDQLEQGADGTFSIILQCKTKTAQTETPAAPFFRADLEVREGMWHYIAPIDGEEPGGAVAPTVEISSATANNDGTVTLAATVSNGGSAVTDADGNVVFTSGSTTGEAAVNASGVATWTSPVLTAGQAYSFTAKYVPNAGDTKYLESADSPAQPVTVVAEPQEPQDTNVTVTIPSSATGLKFTVTDGDVALSAPVLEGATYVATGTLPQVTVTDARATKSAWTLSGLAGAFTKADDEATTIDAKYLGWAPALAGETNAGTAGAVVEAGVGEGLGEASPLAQAAAGATSTVTAVTAGLTLKAPVDSAAGSYSAKLTLTLMSN